MSQLFSEDAAPGWILQRIIDFFNSAQTAEEIRDTVKDDPMFGDHSNPDAKPIAIGLTVAQRILDHRNSLPGNRFRTITQLNGIQGLGEDKFRDLIYTFRQSADEAFIESMYNGVIYKENFKLEQRHIHFFDEETFKQVVDCDTSFTNHVAEIIEEWVQDRNNGERSNYTRLSKEYLKGLYLEKTDNADYGSYYFAYWFYRFDADNWFSYDRVRQETAAYLEYNSRHEDRLELRFYKGFKHGLLIGEAITVDDLPVVVNYGELKITVWSGSLFD